MKHDYIWVALIALIGGMIFNLIGDVSLRKRLEKLEQEPRAITLTVTNTGTEKLFTVSPTNVFATNFVSMNPKIAEIRWRHKHITGMMRTGIETGFLACERGLSLSNYLAGIEAIWAKQLDDQIAEAEGKNP